MNGAVWSDFLIETQQGTSFARVPVWLVERWLVPLRRVGFAVENLVLSVLVASSVRAVRWAHLDSHVVQRVRRTLTGISSRIDDSRPRLHRILSCLVVWVRDYLREACVLLFGDVVPSVNLPTSSTGAARCNTGRQFPCSSPQRFQL